MKEQLKIIGLCAMVFSILFACNNDDSVITIPSEVSSLTAEAGEEQVTLTWSKSSDSDVKEYWITMDPLVMDAFSIDKTLETYTLENLEGDIEYTFTLLVKNMSGGVSNGVSATAKPTPIDRTPPADVTNLSSLSDDGKITLSWTKPSDDDLAGYELFYTPGDVNISLDNDVESYVIEGLTNGTEYTFVLKTEDLVNNISNGSTVKATPTEGDNIAPAEVSGFMFSGDFGATQFTAVWANPTDTDFQEVELTYFFDSANPTTIIIPESENSITIDGSYEQNYTLVFKTKDANGNFSTGVTKKIRFGNYSVGSQADIDAFDVETVAILAGKLKMNGTDATDLSNFSNLERVEGKFDINDNPKITNLDAFSNLNFIASRILITGNANLTDFCGLKNLINAGGAPDSYTVTGNASNPTKQEILDNCN